MRNGNPIQPLPSCLLLLLFILSLQLTLVSSSRDLLLNAPSSKDSLFLSQPSRDWAPGGKLAEAARRKHNAKAARLRNGASPIPHQEPNNSNQQSDESNAGYAQNQSGPSASASDGLDDRIRDGMRLHLDHNGLPTDPDRQEIDLSEVKQTNKEEDLAGKSEDRLVTSGQKDQADRDANRIAQNPNKEAIQEETPKDIESHDIKETKESLLEQMNSQSEQKQNSQPDASKQEAKGDEEANRKTTHNPRPPAQIIQTQNQPISDDDTWERSDFSLFSKSNNKGTSRGRSGRRYSTNKGGLINSLKKLSTSFDSDDDFDEIIKSSSNPNRFNQNGDNRRKAKINKEELERLKGKNREEALKQAEEAARNAVEDEKIFRDRSKDEQMPSPNVN